RQVTLPATGSEVATAMDARMALASEGINATVVSMPCWELFAQQDESYRASVLGTVLRVGVEAGVSMGWDRWLGPDGIFIGMSSFGASAPFQDLYKHFGITPDAIVAAVKKRLG
ncbi:MAG: transketolase, partial [Acetobacteraceae bacterium]|nr:transketolase [Acetobacteraceae bacterium]